MAKPLSVRDAGEEPVSNNPVSLSEGLNTLLPGHLYVNYNIKI
jgi:hypothetical protein